MISSPESVAAQFTEFRAAHLAAGGQRGGLKYPAALRDAAVTCLRRAPGADIDLMASEFGVGSAALKRWDSQTPRSRRPPPIRPRAAFLPLEVVEAKAAAPAARLARGHLVVSCREIHVDLGAAADEALLRAVLSALQSGAGGMAL